MPSPLASDRAKALREVTKALIGQIVTDEHQYMLDDLREMLPRKETYWKRKRGLQAMRRYISTLTPELLTSDGLSALDVGPGVGYWMEIARALGHQVSGVDAAPYSPTVQTFSDITDELDLEIEYVGWDNFETDERFDIVHLRGSLDAIVGGYLEDQQRKRVRAFAAKALSLLVPDGVLHVTHNLGASMEMIQDELLVAPGFLSKRVDKQTTRHVRE